MKYVRGTFKSTGSQYDSPKALYGGSKGDILPSDLGFTENSPEVCVSKRDASK